MNLSFPPGLEPGEDLSAAVWVEEALKSWPRDRSLRVRDLVPPVFEGYARILHHPSRPRDVRDATGTWIERAEELGRPLGPETRWEALTYAANDPWSLHEGSISEGELQSLVRTLGRETARSPACWFALWSGFGFLRPQVSSSYLIAGGSIRQRLVVARMRMKEWVAQERARLSEPRFRTFKNLDGGRSYILFQGALEDAIRLHRQFEFYPPTLWWAEDRTWFVHTEIDAVSTYLGGSRALVDRLVGEQILESFEVAPDTLAAL